MKTTIEVYTFTLRKNRKKDEFLNFGDNPDVYEELANNKNGLLQYIDSNVTGDVIAEKASLRIKKGCYLKDPNDRYLSGIIETGHYGKEYSVVDKDEPNNEKKTWHLGKANAILKPFFYFIKIPQNGTKALLILERVENDGISSLMRTILVGFINDKLGVDPGYRFDKKPYISKEYLKEVSNGKYTSYTITKNTKSSDLSEQYDGIFEENDIILEFKFKFKKGLSELKEKQIRDIIDSGNSFFDSDDLNNLLDGGTKKVISSVNNRDRTLYLNSDRYNVFKPYYDLDVEEEKNGFSKYDSIQKEVINFIKHNNELNIIYK